MAKRTPEEIKAQREAFLAAKAAKAAGKVPETDSSSKEASAEKVPASTEKEQATAAVDPAVEKPATVKPKPKVKPGSPPEPANSNITRREFFNYAWLTSIALVSLQTVGLSLWFAFPKFKAGQFGGEFTIGKAADVLPEVNAGPKAYTDGKFWLANFDTEIDGKPQRGVVALYKVCTHLGCLYDWVPMTNRFECPCHGSRFKLTGDYIDGPARRDLDQFVVKAVSPDGSVKETDAEGNPLVINGDETLIIDTGSRIEGSSDIEPG